MKNTNILSALFIIFIMSVISFSIPSCKSANEKQKGAIFKFDTLSARVVPNSNFVLLGDKFKAEIFLSAFSTTQPLSLETDSSKNTNQSISYKNGICTYEVIPDSTGTYKFNGKIKIKDPSGNGRDITFPFQTEYTVARPQALIVPSEFVLYREKENKIDVSIPGIASEDIYILVSNASVKGENGKFTVIPTKTNTCLISVFARTKNGGKMMDQREYKVVDK